MPYGCLSRIQIRVKAQADRCELGFTRRHLQTVKDVETKLRLAIITFLRSSSDIFFSIRTANNLALSLLA